MATEPEADASALVDTLARLYRIQEPSELIYRRDSPLSADAPPEGVVEDYAVTVARRVSFVLSRLSQLADPNTIAVLTPRAILQRLMDVMRSGLLMGLPEEMRDVGRDGDSHAAAFHLYVSSRRVPIGSMAEGLHAITYVSVKLRVEMVSLLLKRRLEEEMRNAVHEEELAALLVTETLLDDFVEIYHNLLLTIPAGKCISEHHASMLLPTVMRYYYQLGDWVLLTSNVSTVSPLSYTRVTKLSYDDKKGTLQLELHRPSASSPWGLLFNEKNRLIGLDVSMRIHDKARQLHALLKCTQGGAVVSAVNDKNLPVSASDFGHQILVAIRDASSNRKTIKLTVKSPAFKASVRNNPFEVAFSLPPQGGEGASGQRASLLLHRLTADVVWQFGVDEQLRWVPPPLKLLSDEAKVFVRRYAKRLRLLAINGVEVHSVQQVIPLVQGVEAVLLDLVVLTPSKSHAHMMEDMTEDVGGAETETLTPLPPRDSLEAASAAAPVNVTAESIADIAERVQKATQLNLSQAQISQLAEAKVVDGISDSTLPDVEKATKKKKKSTKAKKAQQTEAAATAIETDPTSTGDIDNNNNNENSVANPGSLVFDNNVELLSLSETEMVFQRPSTDSPWGLQLTKSIAGGPSTPEGLHLSLLKLPPVSNKLMSVHPFKQTFDQERQAWHIASVNGKSAKHNTDAMLKLIAKATKLSLRFLRK